MKSIIYLGMDVHTTNYTLCCYTLEDDRMCHLQQIAPALRVQASGGVRELADVPAAKAQGCAGIVLGRALLEGRLDLGEALAC